LDSPQIAVIFIFDAILERVKNVKNGHFLNGRSLGDARAA
jgi:hypothetical protein